MGLREQVKMKKKKKVWREARPIYREASATADHAVGQQLPCRGVFGTVGFAPKQKPTRVV